MEPISQNSYANNKNNNNNTNASLLAQIEEYAVYKRS